MASSSPSKTSPGKLSYLPSDVEEDPGIIDFDEPQYDFLDKDEFYLCEDIFVDDPSAYDEANRWLNSVFEPKDHDPYFDVQQPVNSTPVNGFSRENYLSNNGGRFNTVTRRKNENVENEAPKAPTVVPQIGPRFGTITKRTLKGFNINSQNSSSPFANNNNNSSSGSLTNGSNGSTSTTAPTHSSRIPAMPKSTSVNRSAIPVPGAIPQPTGYCNNETLVKRRLESVFPGATSKLGSQAHQHLVANNFVDDNSWQNDCF